MSTCCAHRCGTVCGTVDSSVTKQWVQQGVSLEGFAPEKREVRAPGPGPWDLYRRDKTDVIYQHLPVKCAESFSRWGMGGAVCVNMIDGGKEFLQMTHWATSICLRKGRTACVSVFSDCVMLCCYFVWVCVCFCLMVFKSATKISVELDR